MALLLKGFEVEMYTGTLNAEAVGLSDQIIRALPDFMREPDQRNVEYATPPLRDYHELLCALLMPRCQLRHYLRGLGNYTLIPGSTLAMGDSNHFLRSDPENSYHDRIEQLYGTRVVTSSIHINFGIEDPEDILKASRLLRLEAPVLLALSASSPFLDGEATGLHSTRWLRFPQTPETVPLFLSHAHYINWVESQLRLGTMFNVRHLWSSVRPNGVDRPYNINRVELRISDLVSNPSTLLGITALIETRLLALLSGAIPDPLTGSFTPQELIDITRANEQAAARDSLDAELVDWQTGRTLSAREWAERWLVQAIPVSRERGFADYLPAVEKVLLEGNEAIRWLKQHQSGVPVAQIMKEAIVRLALEEADLRSRLCTERVAGPC